MLMTWGNKKRKTTHFKLFCVQRYGRGTSERACLGGGRVESAHKGAPGCCQRGTWKSSSAGSIAPCTKACAGSEPPQPLAAGKVRAYTQLPTLWKPLAKKAAPQEPSLPAPATTALRLLHFVLRADSQPPPASGEEDKKHHSEESIGTFRIKVVNLKSWGDQVKWKQYHRCSSFLVITVYYLPSCSELMQLSKTARGSWMIYSACVPADIDIIKNFSAN